MYIILVGAVRVAEFDDYVKAYTETRKIALTTKLPVTLLKIK